MPLLVCRLALCKAYQQTKIIADKIASADRTKYVSSEFSSPRNDESP